MNITEFYNYIKHPDLLNELTLNELNEVLQRYPFFQAARMLYLKNLALLNDDRYNTALTLTSLYAPNRKALYQLIHNEEVLHDNLSVKNSNLKNTDVNESPNKLLTEINKKDINQETNVKIENEVERSAPVSTIADDIIAKINALNETKKTESQLQDDKKISFDIITENKKLDNDASTMTFDEWLYHISNKKTEQNEKHSFESANPNAIIDQFLDNANQISRIKANPNSQNEDLTENLTPPEELEIVSEPLAQLYYKQGYYERALKIYEKLFLKYPEKSIYFATLIQEIKNKLNKS